MKPVVVISGASKGIGLHTARLFHENGYSVVGVSRTDPRAEHPFFSEYYVADMGKREQIISACQKIRERFPKIQVIVNNAGLAGENSFDLSDDDSFWNEIINVNLNGTYYLTKYLLPQMESPSTIVNVSSVLGLKGVPDQVAYCAAKHGVIGFTRALAHRLASQNIRVNAVCPGWVETEMALSRFQEINCSKEDIVRAIPLGRICHPDDVARVILFLSGKESAMITGQTVTVDGGALA
jgi:NAD(P)-dependent dehydrogenase (short-subunit alcohol dehydrogenase family)